MALLDSIRNSYHRRRYNIQLYDIVKEVDNEIVVQSGGTSAVKLRPMSEDVFCILRQVSF